MSRPTTITDASILDAARSVFLEHGIRGTTAEVAHRAGVSEGIVFKRFKSKEALFRRAMMLDSVDASAWVAALPARVGAGELREQLHEIGVSAARFFEQMIPLHMHAWANRGHEESLSTFGDFDEPPPLTARKRIASYFEGERRLGRLGDVDPDVLGRIFLGSIYNFVSLEIMLQGHDPHPMPTSSFVRGLVDVILGSGAPRAIGAPATPRRPKRPR